MERALRQIRRIQRSQDGPKKVGNINQSKPAVMDDAILHLYDRSVPRPLPAYPPLSAIF
jgi:hypothetical protein